MPANANFSIRINFDKLSGCVPNVQRAALVNLGDLTAYDQAKTFLVIEGFNPDSKVKSNKCKVFIMNNVFDCL